MLVVVAAKRGQVKRKERNRKKKEGEKKNENGNKRERECGYSLACVGVEGVDELERDGVVECDGAVIVAECHHIVVNTFWVQ